MLGSSESRENLVPLSFILLKVTSIKPEEQRAQRTSLEKHLQIMINWIMPAGPGWMHKNLTVNLYKVTQSHSLDWIKTKETWNKQEGSWMMVLLLIQVIQIRW